MIDTHCHLLPETDDGPSTLRESLELARALDSAGVTSVICTPHLSRRYPTDLELARDRVDVLTDELEQAGIPLALGLAAEVSSAVSVEAPAEALLGRRLGRNHLLVELEPPTPAGIVALVMRRLGEIGLKPVFAHPERCRAVRSQPHLLDAAREAGARVQVVAQSLSGSWGGEVERAAWRLLESGRVDLLASDAHRHHQAGPRLTRVLEAISTRLGAASLHALTETNPASLLGRPVEDR